MDYRFCLYFLSFSYTWNFLNCAYADINLSDETSNCDFTRFEMQLETLKAGNEFLKLGFEMMQLQLDKQKELLQGLDKKLDRLPQNLQNTESKGPWSRKENLQELNDLIIKQNRIIQSNSQTSTSDEKMQILSDIKQIVKEHDVLFRTFSEKLKNIEMMMKKGNWETELQQLGNNVSQNLPILQSIDKKITNMETITELKENQITFKRNIEKYFNKNEATKICLQTEDKKLSCTSHPYPTSCADFNPIHCADNKCRIFNHVYGPEPFLVACDDQTDGGGWTVIQRRINGSVNFYRDWSEYKNGFGNINGELFIGMDRLHALTNTLQPVELLIQLIDFNDTLKYAKYDEFIVANETEKYKLLKVGKYTGDAGDSFSYHEGYYFTTKDRDNDIDPKENCAQDKTGAWWYEKCMWSNLNGKYFAKDYKIASNERGICWNTFNGYLYSMKFAQMLIRPKKL